jgi:cytoskeleton protein RodZ
MSQGPSAQPALQDADATPGALLKRERERASLTVQQAAEDLHLDPWIIEAIEANRFQALGAPVYAKGHLRKYATRLSLPVEELVARYEALQDRPVAADPIPAAVASPVPPPRRSWKGLIWTVVAVLVVALLAYLANELVLKKGRFVLPWSSDATSTVAPSTTTAPPGVEASASNVVAPEPARASTLSAAAPTVMTPASAATEAGAIGASIAEPIRVRLEFSGESWTEVYDATGARVMFGMGTPERVRTLTGTPPLQVSLGAASAVSLQVNGEQVVIPRRDGREAARFTIDANGNLR